MNEATHLSHIFIGIDVSKQKLDCAALLNDKIKSKVVSNDQPGFSLLDTWLRERGAVCESAHICLEATGPYSEQVAFNPLLKPVLMWKGDAVVSRLARRHPDSLFWRRASRALKLAKGELRSTLDDEEPDRRPPDLGQADFAGPQA